MDDGDVGYKLGGEIAKSKRDITLPEEWNLGCCKLVIHDRTFTILGESDRETLKAEAYIREALKKTAEYINKGMDPEKALSYLAAFFTDLGLSVEVMKVSKGVGPGYVPSKDGGESVDVGIRKKVDAEKVEEVYRKYFGGVEK